MYQIIYPCQKIQRRKSDKKGVESGVPEEVGPERKRGWRGARPVKEGRSALGLVRETWRAREEEAKGEGERGNRSEVEGGVREGRAERSEAMHHLLLSATVVVAVAA